MPDSKISPADLLQDLDVQSLISYQSLQALVLFLQILKSLRLTEVHAAVFLTPAVICLLGNTELTGNFLDGLALGDEDLGFTQEVDDLLVGEAFLGYDSPFRMIRSLTLNLDLF